MSKVLEIAAMLLGGFSILAVCFFGFSLTAGVPLHELAIVGDLFEAPPEGQRPVAPAASPEPVPATRAPAEVLRSNLGVLGTWSLPSPYDEEELASLAAELKATNRLLEVRAGELDRRAQELDEEERLLGERFAALRELQRRLEDHEAELILREQEVQSQEGVAAEHRMRASADLARLFESLDAKAGASFLAALSAGEAAAVLRQMDVERAAELLDALRSQGGTDWKAYLEAYSQAPPPGT